jgi:hypothetical protein
MASPEVADFERLAVPGLLVLLPPQLPLGLAEALESGGQAEERAAIVGIAVGGEVLREDGRRVDVSFLAPCRQQRAAPRPASVWEVAAMWS